MTTDNTQMLEANSPYAATPAIRSLREIAREVRQTWPKVYFGAVPYLDAMSQLNSIQDKFYEDSAKSIVIYFLANAQTWKGEDARRIKAELKRMAGIR